MKDKAFWVTLIILIVTIVPILLFKPDYSDRFVKPRPRPPKAPEPIVIKTERYNSSYDNQIDALKRDIKKSDIKSIAIYDDNCDTVATIYKEINY